MGCGLLCDPRFRGRRVALLLPCPEWPLSPRELDRPSVRRAERGQACGLRAGMTGSATCDGGSTTLSQVPAPTASAGNDQDVRAFRCGHAGNPAAGSTVLTYRARMVNGCMQLPNWTTPAMVGLPAVSLAEIIALPISSPAQSVPSRGEQTGRSRAISVDMAPTTATPAATLMRPRAAVAGRTLQTGCNDLGYGSSTIAATCCDDRGSLRQSCPFHGVIPAPSPIQNHTMSANAVFLFTGFALRSKTPGVAILAK